MLTPQQEQQHRKESRANLEASGLDRATVCAALGFTAARLARTLAVTDGSPVDVWLLRDFLDQVLRDHGDTPTPWTVLVDHRRARRWFDLASPPPTPVFEDVVALGDGRQGSRPERSM